MRFVKNVGLGFKTPKTAREGNYVDKKCPFTGDVSIRGRILKVCSCRALVVMVVFFVGDPQDSRRLDTGQQRS